MTANNFYILNKPFFEFQKRELLKRFFNEPFADNLKIYIPGIYLNPSTYYEVTDYTFVLNILEKLLPHELYQELHTVLISYRNKEKLMFETSQFYRDNLSHMAKVAITGSLLFNLEFILSGEKKIIDYFSDLLNIDKYEILKLWFFTALYHDIGQPWDTFGKPPFHIVDNIINKGLFSKPSAPVENILKEYDRFIEFISVSINNVNILSKIRHYIEKEGGSTDHGVVAAYILYGVAQDKNLLKNRDYQKLLQLVCRIILLHTCFEKIEWPDGFFAIKDFPLDFYFYLIDKMQECLRKVRDKKTSKFRILEITESQDLLYSSEYNYIANRYDFTNEEALNDAGFKYKKHLEDKYDGVNKTPKFLKMFKKNGFNFPDIHFIYKYLDTNEDKIKKYRLKF
ncbi:hypothetical protein LCGC14_0505580 [marine sediment metagenome]|uniref:Uncharacterized protein n=1 Tax=marine sediment metagenome TaxID=412755 RepID=A0A0F9VB73_9ZZZZ|nr:MAG: hypothetical protein Lokiarch_52950 [Candidatus Lokiarchaeum sp. GC14_75]